MRRTALLGKATLLIFPAIAALSHHLKQRPGDCHQATTLHTPQHQYDLCSCTITDQSKHPRASLSYHWMQKPHISHLATMLHTLHPRYDPCRCAPADRSEHPTISLSYHWMQ